MGNKSWLFTFTFALATTSVVSGCLAERTNLMTYPLVAILMTMWIHPVVAFWVWHPDSWLYGVSQCKFLDFAGGTVVHVIGACRAQGCACQGRVVGRGECGECARVGVTGGLEVGRKHGHCHRWESRPFQAVSPSLALAALPLAPLMPLP
eukprot:199387-Chlamydomonas_euryale.AAC.1